MLYPMSFKDVPERVENAAVCLQLGTDVEGGEFYDILLMKKEVAALIGLLSTHLAEMKSEP